MTVTNVILIVASLACAGVMFAPRLLRAPLWRATVTPLASIIGSGFLVVGPILAHTVGNLAWLAMLFLCAAAFLFASAIQHNIVRIEPQLAKNPAPVVKRIEDLSSLALSLAYFVSIAYYLNLFAAFGLRLADIRDPQWVRIAATIVIASVGLIGVGGGLRALEKLEIGAVGLKLSVIGGLFVTLLFADGTALAGGNLVLDAPSHAQGFDEFRVLLGLIILVQGFETSRYLGEEYDAATRIRTMRWAQWIATGIYLVFIVLITPYFTGKLQSQSGETAIIDMLRPVGSALAPMIILIALASQLSAAVADTNGAGGLLAETSGRITPNLGHLVAALAAIAITWSANIYEIITYASRAFVAYYGLQSLQALISAWRHGRRWHAAVFGLGVVLAAIVVVFAEPLNA